MRAPCLDPGVWDGQAGRPSGLGLATDNHSNFNLDRSASPHQKCNRKCNRSRDPFGVRSLALDDLNRKAASDPIKSPTSSPHRTRNRTCNRRHNPFGVRSMDLDRCAGRLFHKGPGFTGGNFCTTAPVTGHDPNLDFHPFDTYAPDQSKRRQHRQVQSCHPNLHSNRSLKAKPHPFDGGKRKQPGYRGLRPHHPNINQDQAPLDVGGAGLRKRPKHQRTSSNVVIFSETNITV